MRGAARDGAQGSEDTASTAPGTRRLVRQHHPDRRAESLRGQSGGRPRARLRFAQMLPINGACTPFDVKPTDWTNTAVTITLLPNVTSGPIGFADLVYVTA